MIYKMDRPLFGKPSFEQFLKIKKGLQGFRVHRP